jgi:nicotinate-nucleotide adenylyltransferase
MKTSEAVRPLGILGGTFDPVHLAHLALARVAIEKLGLAQVRWIPAGQPWHRGMPGAAPADRLAMVQAAIAGEPHFTLDPAEVMDVAPGYTVDTLQRLRRELGDQQPLVLLMGADAFHGLTTWQRWREIFALAHIGVATRPGFPLQDFVPELAAEFANRHSVANAAGADFSTPAGSIYDFELIAGTVSATEVRETLAAGAPDAKLHELLPVPVLDYIRRNHLYST